MERNSNLIKLLYHQIITRKTKMTAKLFYTANLSENVHLTPQSKTF